MRTVLSCSTLFRLIRLLCRSFKNASAGFQQLSLHTQQTLAYPTPTLLPGTLRRYTDVNSTGSTNLAVRSDRPTVLVARSCVLNRVLRAATNLVAITNYLEETLTFSGTNLLNDSGLLTVTCTHASDPCFSEYLCRC